MSALPQRSFSVKITDTWKDQKIEFKNYLINNPIIMGGGMGLDSYVLNGDWMNAIEQMGKWYEKNIHTYQGDPPKVNVGHHTGRKAHPCPLIGGKNVFDDCSSFVTACVLAFGVKKDAWTKWPPNTASMQPGSDWDKTLQENGWKYMPFDKNILKPGDIYCGGPSTHVEICAGIGMQYGWGSVHDNQGGRGGMPCGTPRSYLMHGTKSYEHIWRRVN